MSDGTKVLLIGGASHVGKSTFAGRLAAELGWTHLSTDQLARHPGRPWRNDATSVPADVVEHYANGSTAELLDAVLQHYRHNIWPIVEAWVRSHVNNPYDRGLVFEGSAILPDLAAAARFDRCAAVWLTAPEGVITERIRESSRFDGRPDAQRQLIEAFRERALAFDGVVRESVERLEQPSVDASAPNAFERLRALVG